MTSPSITELNLKFNEKFKENQAVIEKLQAQLLKDISTMNFTQNELQLSREYIEDKVNIFRFLKEKRYDYNTAYTDLRNTIQWRMETKMDQLDYNTCSEFFKEGFAFYHGTDNSGDYPLLFVRLRYFPREFHEPEKTLSQQLQPFACYLFEIARKYTWELTRNRISENHPNPLVWKVKVIVNVAKAPLIPIDGQIIKTLGPMLGANFPGFISSIHVLNFGWMYQGIWSVLKYLLSEKAKSFINFTSIKELGPIISEDRILKEMGGSNDFNWTFENDTVLQKYGKKLQIDEEVISQVPEATPPLSPSTSSSASDDSEDEFFDAPDTFPTVQKEPVVPSTFKPKIVPLSVAGHVPSSMIKGNTAISRMQAIFKQFLYNLFQLTFGPKRGLFYWVLLYVILRGPVEKFIKTMLIRSNFVKSKQLNSTTIGITATVAAIVSTGISSAFEKYRK